MHLINDGNLENYAFVFLRLFDCMGKYSKYNVMGEKVGY